MNKHHQAIINEMGDNSIVVFADMDGARIYARLRGATAEEMGHICGSATASFRRQIQMIKDQLFKTKGNAAINQFIDGYKAGEKSTPDHEGIRLRELPQPENDHG